MFSGFTPMDLNSCHVKSEVEKKVVLRGVSKSVTPQFTSVPWSHRFLLNLIKSLQPVLAILRGVLQKKERNGGHGSGDIADVPLAALPDRAEVRGFFARIVAFAGAQLIEPNRDRSRQ